MRSATFSHRHELAGSGTYTRHDAGAGWYVVGTLMASAVALALGLVAAARAPYGPLTLPWWAPEPWTLAVAAGAVALVTAIAGGLVARQHGELPILVAWAMSPFYLALTLGVLWAVALFGLHAPIPALALSVVLLGAVIATMLGFFILSRDGMWWMLPALAAAGAAVAFSAVVYALNPYILDPALLEAASARLGVAL